MKSSKQQMTLDDLSSKDQLRLSQLKSDELSAQFPKAKYGLKRDALRKLWREAKQRFEVSKETIETDIKNLKTKQLHKETEKKNKILFEEVETLRKENEALLTLKETQGSHEIQPLAQSNQEGEATALLIASDWHVEERVSRDAINNLNEYSVAIARQRADEFFQTGLKLINLEKRNTNIPNLVLVLLGDFITGNIHEENLATCSLPPIAAALEAQEIIKSGIDFLLKESDLKKIIIPCHSGNHARITQKRRSSETELGNSLELFVYSSLAKIYENEPRIEFIISRSYTSKIKIYQTVLRLHHGHSIRYQGGIGGLAVPTQRYRLRANTAWTADYDIFGHHHQKQFGAHYICNGSMIGYNAYAQDCGFEFEVPSQTYLLINKRFKDIIDYRPIFFSA